MIVCLRLRELNRSGLPSVGPGRRWVTWPDRFWFLTTKVANWSEKKTKFWFPGLTMRDMRTAIYSGSLDLPFPQLKIFIVGGGELIIFFNRSWVKPTVSKDPCCRGGCEFESQCKAMGDVLEDWLHCIDNLLGPNARLSYCHGSPLIRRLFFRDNY